MGKGGQMAKKNSKTMSLLESMTKEELIELIRHSGFLFGRYVERRIADAKGSVARRQADQAFEQYDKLAQEAIEMPKDTLDQLAAWETKFKESERFLRRYNRLWARADLLQYGPQKKESANAAK